MTEKEQLEHDIALLRSLEKLRSYKEFKEIFTDYYLKNYCAEAVKASTYNTENKEYFLERARAAGYLEQFLDYIETQGKKAEEELINYLNRD